MPEPRMLGCIPDKPDERDYGIRLGIPEPASIPSWKDYRGLLNPIRDQDGSNACVGFSVSELVAFLEYAWWDAKISYYSPMAVWYWARLQGGYGLGNVGCSIRDAIKILFDKGIPMDTEFPFDLSKLADPPPEQAVISALNHKIASYNKLQNLQEMKECIASGNIFVFGYPLFESFYLEPCMSKGLMPVPMLGEILYGYHAVVAVGYEDSKEHLIVRNHWGSNIHDGGYFYMPYEVVISGQTFDAWTIIKKSKNE